MRRRDVLLSGVAAPLLARAAGAQSESRKVLIGWLATGNTIPLPYFQDAMMRLGWIEGRNLAVERRITGHDPARRAQAIAELVALRPELIVTGGATDALPLRAVTRDIPIVVIGGTDLIEAGLVESLARPGGNVTGLTVLGRELDGKRLELVRELLPNATRVSMLGNQAQRMTQPRLDAAEVIARSLSLSLVRRMAAQPAELDAVFATVAADKDQAILIPFNALTFEDRPRIITLAAKFGLPAIYEFGEFVKDGGLMSYGAIYRDYFERAAILADKVIRGVKPANLPVEQPTRFELAINLKAAKHLGLAVPQTLLARAEEVIE